MAVPFDNIFLTGLFEGDFFTGHTAVMGLLEGQFFPVQDDFYLIYKDRNNANYDYYDPIVRMGESDTSVGISDIKLEPDTGRSIWHFGRIAVSRYGVISTVSDDCLVTVDSDAIMVLPCGNDPVGVEAAAIKDGSVRLQWQYFSQGEDAEPTGFKVYREVAGAWSLESDIDFTGSRNYQYDVTGLTHGVNYKFTARSYKLGDNLVVNGTMEADSNWATYSAADVNERSSEQVHAGMYSRKFHCTSSNDGIVSDPYASISGKQYRVSAWVYPVGHTAIKIAVHGGAAVGYISSADHTLITDTWNYVEFDVTDTTAGGAFGSVRFSSHLETDETWYVDDVLVAMYHETVGEIVTEATADDTGPAAITSITATTE
ncbi:MAG: fibronectin type III domain-containing protein [FCB group bacterium]|nr:fibronectin type III domain-containing protein [FCB group bacterium]